MPLTRHNPELDSLNGGPIRAPTGPQPILCTHRAWLARRTAELGGREPVPASIAVAFDGRAELLHCRHGFPASKQHLCEKCMAEAAGYA